MTAYDPTAGELRTHYAGFFDPGFGFDPTGDSHGSRARRSRSGPATSRSWSSTASRVCKLAFERMLRASPSALYGDDVGSQLPGPGIQMLSKHFEEQTAGVSELRFASSEPER